MTYDTKQKNQKLFHLTELYKQRIRKDFLWRSVEYYGSWYECYFLLIALQCALSRWLELNVFWSGIGRPRFSSEDNCTYVFDWETQYACIDKPASCQLLSGQHLFDLSPLMRPDSMGKSLNIYMYICTVQIPSSWIIHVLFRMTVVYVKTTLHKQRHSGMIMTDVISSLQRFF